MCHDSIVCYFEWFINKVYIILFFISWQWFSLALAGIRGFHFSSLVWHFTRRTYGALSVEEVIQKFVPNVTTWAVRLPT
jgi:hypothetical protein